MNAELRKKLASMGHKVEGQIILQMAVSGIESRPNDGLDEEFAIVEAIINRHIPKMKKALARAGLKPDVRLTGF